MAAAKKRCFLRFLYFTESSPPSFKVRGLQMTMNLAVVFHIILDTQGPSCYKACLNLCASSGHVVTLVTPLNSMTDKHGLVWGAVKATCSRLKIGLPQKLFHSRSFSWGIYAPDGEALDKIRKLVEAGKIKPVIEETFPLSEGVSAFKQLASGHRKGKIVIDVDSR